MKTKTRILSFVLVVLLICSLCAALTGCQKNTDSDKKFTSLDDFGSAVIGDNTASVLGKQFKEKYPDAEIKYYDDNAAICAALRKGDIEAAILDDPIARNITASYSDFAIFPTKVSSDNYGMLFADGNPLRESFDKCIETYREDGTLDALREKWFSADTAAKVIDREAYAVSNPSAETLRVAYEPAGYEPMSYTGEDKLPVGYEVEMLYMIARELNLKLEFVSMNSAALFSALETGKADVVASCISITEEREEKFDFTVPTYYGGTVLLCRKDTIDVQSDPDLNDPSITIAIQPSTTTGTEAQKKYPNAEFIYVTNDTDGIMQVTSGKADAYAIDLNYYEARRQTGKTDIRLHKDNIIGPGGDIAVAISRKTKIPNAADELNAFINSVKEDGTLDDMLQRWAVKNDYTIPEIEKPSNPDRTFIIGTSGLAEPYTFMQGDQLTGFEIELAQRFGAYCNANIEFAVYDWAGLDAACASGKVDYVFSNYYVTPEKQENMDFSVPYLSVKTVMAVADTQSAADEETFFQKIASSFEKTFIRENRWQLILSGIGVTLEITLLAALFGTVLGFVLFLLCESGKTPDKIIRVCSNIIQNIPVLVVLMIVYFVVFGRVDISPVLAGIIAFSLVFGLSVLGILSAGVKAINHGQYESALALGLNKPQIYTRILIPQIVRLQLPIYKGELVGLLKSTAIVGYISVMDLTKAGDIIRSRTFEAFFPLLASAFIYYLLANLIILLANRVNVAVDPNRHSGKLPKGITEKSFTPVAASGSGSEKGRELIALKNITKAYEDITPLNDISATVYSGDVISIIGPSGTGKSTLLRMMNGLEKPTSGAVEVFGENICAEKADPQKIRMKLGMVFQSYSLFDHLNVIENLMLAPMLLKNVSADEAYADGMTLLRSVGMAERALQMPSQLSGGQRQRVAIARAMAMHPEVILFDEPTSALDPKNIGEVLSVIRRFRDDTTMLIVTHELQFAKTVANRVWYMDKGGIYEDGTPEQVFGNPIHNRTRAFVNKMNVLPCKLDAKGFDEIETEEELHQFCTKHYFSREKEDNILALFRALMQDKIVKMVPKDDSVITFLIEYSEEPLLTEVKFFWNGEKCDQDILAEIPSEQTLNSTLSYENGQNALIISLP